MLLQHFCVKAHAASHNMCISQQNLLLVVAAKLDLCMEKTLHAYENELCVWSHLGLLSFWPLICLQELHQAWQCAQLLLICCCPLVDISLPRTLTLLRFCRQEHTFEDKSSQNAEQGHGHAAMTHLLT